MGLPLKILLMVPKPTGKLLPSFPHNAQHISSELLYWCVEFIWKVWNYSAGVATSLAQAFQSFVATYKSFENVPQ